MKAFKSVFSLALLLSTSVSMLAAPVASVSINGGDSISLGELVAIPKTGVLNPAQVGLPCLGPTGFCYELVVEDVRLGGDGPGLLINSAILFFDPDPFVFFSMAVTNPNPVTTTYTFDYDLTAGRTRYLQ